MTRTPVSDAEALTLLGEFVRRASGVATLEELRTSLFEFLTACGIEMMSYHQYPPPGAVDHTRQIAVAARGFPPAWVERYEAEFTLIDPIPRRAVDAVQSFFWSDAINFPDLCDAERYYLSQLAAANLGDGLAVPLFGPRGRSGYAGLGFGPGNPRPSLHVITLLRTACQLGHQEYCRLLFAHQSPEATLSAREKEILNWVARGKSNAVIAEILAISGHTVDTHLRRTFGKLSVQDRVTAALRGSALGLL